ncbi:hypothetical protein B7463_g2219, partial [Scytalidium lignicola]
MSLQLLDAEVWDPNSTTFPTRKELPKIPNAPEGAAWFWGNDDNIGRLNLLTPQRVKAAAANIMTGELVRLDLPMNVPEVPSFQRETFVHTIKEVMEGMVFDDKHEVDTQSGSQWDGFRHFSHLPSKTFYNGVHLPHPPFAVTSTDIIGSDANERCSIHHWSSHGIAGRGILLNYWGYAKANGINYDPNTACDISLDQLKKCGHAQGIDIRPESQGGDIKIGDILLIRFGWVERYMELSPEERESIALRPFEKLEYAGVTQDESVLDWLHDCYFAAVAGDAPTFERWPSKQKYLLHEYLLALWGVPLGEMWDLETLAMNCQRKKRWTFFLTSSPANVPGGVCSHANATAIF